MDLGNLLNKYQVLFKNILKSLINIDAEFCNENSTI